MHLTPRASASSGWLPAALARASPRVVVLTAYGDPDPGDRPVRAPI